MEEIEMPASKGNSKFVKIAIGIVSVLLITTTTWYFLSMSDRQRTQDNNLPSDSFVPDEKTLEEGDKVSELHAQQGLFSATDLVIGTGEKAENDNLVTVNYKGNLLDGEEFDSSYKRGEPFSFTLGAGQVIAGWDRGVLGMKVGGKRKLTIPPDLGYGEQGAGSVIPPNSTLIFEVELLSVEK